MEFVDGSLRVYITRENGGRAESFAEMEYSGACVDETKHQISFGFGQSSWKVKKEILPYFIEQHYGNIENFKAAVQDGSWYRKENQNENGKYPWIRIEYRLRLKGQYVDGNPYRVNNTAKLGDWVSASASATVKPKMLKKSMTSDGGLLKYTITVNPSGSPTRRRREADAHRRDDQPFPDDGFEPQGDRQENQRRAETGDGMERCV